MLMIKSSYKPTLGMTERIWERDDEIITRTKDMILEVDEGLIKYGEEMKETWSIRDDIIKTLTENINTDFFSKLKGKKVLFLFNELKENEEVIEKMQEIAKDEYIDSIVIILRAIEDEETEANKRDDFYKRVGFKNIQIETEIYLKKDII